MSRQLELAFNRVIKEIEPITRFDKASIKQEHDSNVRVTEGKAFWRFSPRISDRGRGKEHTNRLPYHVKRVDSSDKLDEIAKQTYQAACDALSQRVQAWLRINERKDKTLEASDCFDGPKTFGYEYICPNCLGEGSTKCPRCEHGFNICPNCKGERHFLCDKCKSMWGLGKPTGEVDCNKCDGKGTKSGQRCNNCRNGKVDCPKCKGHTIVDCEKCNGRGEIRCPDKCEPLGRVLCRKCDKTGYLHMLRTVECDVYLDWRVDLRKDEKAEVVKELVNRDLDSLRTLASVTQMAPTMEENVVKREYNIECIITELMVSAAGRRIELIGYGDKAEILNYKGLASTLLGADLETLKQAVAKTPLRLWGNPTELFTATKLFLESEVNIGIDNPRWIEENKVTQTYVNEVKTYLPKALEKLFFAHIGLAFLVTVLSPTVIFLISHFTGIREMIGDWVFIAPVTASLASWVLLERRTRNRLTTMFEDNEHKNVNNLFQKFYILWKARGLALVLTVVLLVIAAILPLP